MRTNTIETTVTETPAYAAPGPGSWQHDPAHWTRPVMPWTAEVLPRGFARGFAEGTRRYGLLFSHFEAATVHGQVFYRATPAPDSEVPERIEASRTAFATKLWRRDLELWDSEFKPDSIHRNERLRAVELASLDDAGLAEHLRECHENQQEMVYRHHKFNMAALLPVGNFVAHVVEWTGLPSADALNLLRGASPISLGIAERELRVVGAALRSAGIGPETFQEGLSAACVLEQLRTRTDAVGAAVRAFLDASASHIAGGYDVAYLTVGEMPDLVINSFWQARAAADIRGHEPVAAVERVRALVPEAHRDEFDALLAEARLVSRLRDERGIYNDLWAAGISRLAILEVGRRLALRGRLDDERLVLHASLGEMLALLRGETRPTSQELAERARRIESLGGQAVPAVLGDQPAPLPSLEGLPPHAQVAARALGVAIDEILSNSTEANDERVVRGKPASPGVYEGRARVVSGPEDFNTLNRGDVLVMTSTSASVNVVLPLVGAIVTDRGALLSHAAIVAREYGIPGVVGAREATRIIPDGARVRVDGGRGTVEVLR